MSVRLSDVIAAAAGRHAPLAGETAGYIVLAMADQLVAAPRLVTLEATCLEATGAVRVTGAAADSNVASVALRQVLAELLGVARPVPPALRRVAAGARAGGVPGLVRELEAALIPVNRSAAGRALARLQREAARARDAGVLVAAEPEAAVEATQVFVVADDADTPVDALPPAGAGTVSASPAPPAVEFSPEPPPCPPGMPVAQTEPVRPAPPPPVSPRPPLVVEASPAPPVVETVAAPPVARRPRVTPRPPPVVEASPVPPVAAKPPAPPVVEHSPAPPVVETVPTPRVARRPHVSPPPPPVVEVSPSPPAVEMAPPLPPPPSPTPEPPTIDHVAIGLAQFRVSPAVTDAELRAALLEYSGIERSLQL